MWIKGSNRIDKNCESNESNVNFIFKQDNIYVSDNHLTAAWCWLNHLDLSENYNFCHIDRHYDLLNNLSEKDLNFIKIDPKLDFDSFISELWTYGFPKFRYDNYILPIKRLYPNLFNKNIFVTMRDGDWNGFNYEVDNIYNPNFWDITDISYQLNENSGNSYKWIVNFDLDYFFLHAGEGYIKFFDDQYIKHICSEINNSKENIVMITIALSPECCGGWDNAIRISNKVCKLLNVQLKLSIKKSTL